MSSISDFRVKDSNEVNAKQILCKFLGSEVNDMVQADQVIAFNKLSTDSTHIYFTPMTLNPPSLLPNH
jgi:hypothetical protein